MADVQVFWVRHRVGNGGPTSITAEDGRRWVLVAEHTTDKELVQLQRRFTPSR